MVAHPWLRLTRSCPFSTLLPSPPPSLLSCCSFLALTLFSPRRLFGLQGSAMGHREVVEVLREYGAEEEGGEVRGGGEPPVSVKQEATQKSRGRGKGIEAEKVAEGEEEEEEESLEGLEPGSRG